jgi:hypothetical protein
MTVAMKKIILVLLLASAVYAYRNNHSLDFLASLSGPAQGSPEEAFQKHRNGVILTAEGVVDKILDDDNDGARHQRFIVKLPSGQTLLILHNVELAPRVEGIKTGLPVTVHGEYIWSDKGGRMHWTHKDPRGKHEAGWIQFDGRRYS